MNTSYSHLEHLLVDLVQQIKYHAKHQHLNRHSQIRVEQWLKKITSVTVNALWKKQRNSYAQALLSQIQQGKLSEPFSKVPPEGPLNNLAVPRPVSRPPSKAGSKPGSKAGSRPGSVRKASVAETPGVGGYSDHLANEHYMKYLRKSSSQQSINKSVSMSSLQPNHQSTNYLQNLSQHRRQEETELKKQVYNQQISKAQQQIESLQRQNQLMKNQIMFKDEQYSSLQDRCRALEQGAYY